MRLLSARSYSPINFNGLPLADFANLNKSKFQLVVMVLRWRETSCGMTIIWFVDILL